MDLEFFCILPAALSQVAVVFCAIWPLFAFRFLAKDGRSAAPIAALIVAIAVVQAAIWNELANLVEWLPLVPSFSLAWLVLWPAFWIAVIAWARRHQPVSDGTMIALSALLLAGAIAARVFGMKMQPRFEYFYAARAGTMVALAIAVTAFTRLARARA